MRFNIDLEAAKRTAAEMGALAPIDFPSPDLAQCWIDRVACAASLSDPAKRAEMVREANVYSGRRLTDRDRPAPIRRDAGFARAVDFGNLERELRDLMFCHAEGEV